MYRQIVYETFYISSYEYKIIGCGKDLTLFMTTKLKWTFTCK